MRDFLKCCDIAKFARAHVTSEDCATLDEKTRAKPNRERQALYKELLAKQTDMTRKLHASGYL